MKGKLKESPKVWVYNYEGGREVLFKNLFPEGEVPLKKKIMTIVWIILAFSILIFLLWLSKKYGTD